LRHPATMLVTLGLIGTVIGFMLALPGIDPDRAGEVEAIPAIVGGLLEGRATALDTTLVGAIASLWPMVVVRRLEGDGKASTAISRAGSIAPGAAARESARVLVASSNRPKVGSKPMPDPQPASHGAASSTAATARQNGLAIPISRRAAPGPAQGGLASR
jgi:hypothetical protein